MSKKLIGNIDWDQLALKHGQLPLQPESAAACLPEQLGACYGCYCHNDDMVIERRGVHLYTSCLRVLGKLVKVDLTIKHPEECEHYPITDDWVPKKK